MYGIFESEQQISFYPRNALCLLISLLHQDQRSAVHPRLTDERLVGKRYVPAVGANKEYLKFRMCPLQVK
jgi:hypothetical protein